MSKPRRSLTKINNAIFEVLRADCHPNVESWARSELVPIGVSEEYSAPELSAAWWCAHLDVLLGLHKQFPLDRDTCVRIGEIMQDVDNPAYQR